MTRKRAQSHAHSQNDDERVDKSQTPLSGSPAREVSDTVNSGQGDQAVGVAGTAGGLASHAASRLPQNPPSQANQIDQLVVKLEQQLTQAMRPLLDSLVDDIMATANQQIEPAFEPVRHSLQQQIDQVLQPIHETLHQEVEVALQPVRETLQSEMDRVLQPVRETILQQVEIALRTSLNSPGA